MIKILGIDIGGTKCSVILATYNDEINQKVGFIDKATFPTSKPWADSDTAGSDAVIDRLIHESKQMLEKHRLNNEDITAIGINCGGPLDSKNGIILSPPNLIGWINVPIVQRFEEALGIKSYLQNDANAGAIAENLFGAGRGYENLMFFTFGTGMGAGLILNGKLYSGTNDMAGEVGHIRLDRFGPVGFGKAGSLEGFCSGGGIAQLAGIKALERLQLGEKVSYCKGIDDIQNITTKIVADAAKAGDDLAREVFYICGRYLGYALSIFIDILNPQIIILGSIYGRCKEFLEKPMMEVMDKETIPYSRKVCKITQSELGERINDYEAIAIAIYAIYHNK